MHSLKSRFEVRWHAGRRHWSCGALAILALLSACTSSKIVQTATGGTGSGTSGGMMMMGDAGVCTPDPILLAATTACHLDDQCPCGAHCVLGLCAFECQMDSQCPTGSYCDSFGRCRFQSDQGLIGFAPHQQPTIALRPSTLTISTGDEDVHSIELEITFPGPSDGGVVRIHPDEGITLLCSLGDGGAGTDDGGDCFLASDSIERFGVSLPGSAPVSDDAGIGDAGPLEVHVYIGDQIQTLTINQLGLLKVVPNAPAVPGRYSGEAQLLGILDQAAGDGGGVAPVSIPLTAVVGTVGSSLALQITDPSHALAPFDSWAAPLAGTAGHYTVTLPSYRAFADALLPDSTVGPPGADAGADVEVLIQPALANVNVTGGDSPAISFQLQLAVTGVVAGQALVSSTYEVTLGFDPGDGGAPAPILLDAGDVPFLGGSIGTVPTPWGAAFDQTWTPLPAVGTSENGPADLVALALAAGLQDDAGVGGPLDSCLRTQDDFTTFGGEIFSQLFADSPAAVGAAGTALTQAHAVGTGSSQVNDGPTLKNQLGIGLVAPFSGGFDWRKSQNPALSATADALVAAFGPVGASYLELGAAANMNASANLPFPALPPGQIACALNSSAGTIQVKIAEACGDEPAVYPIFPQYLYCAYNGGAVATSFVANPQIAVTARAIDRCDLAAETYGCTPQTLDAPVAITGTGNWLSGGGDGHLAQVSFSETAADFLFLGEYSDTGSWVATYDPTQAGSPQLTVTRVCQLPVNPPDCLQRATCVNPGATELDDPIAPDLGTQIRSNSGDLICQGAERAADFAIDETIAASDGGISPPAMLAACQQELEAFHSTLPPAVTATGAQGLFPLLPSAECIDGPRWVELLEVAVQEAAINGGLSPAEQGEVHRVFERWLKLHAFVAREEIEREGMAEVLVALKVSDPLGPHIAVQDDLDLSLAGMSLLLHPRFSPLLDQLGGPVLAAPDYRSLIDPAVTFPNYDQSEGLPVAILEALDADVELATVGVNELWAANNPPNFTKLAGFEKVLRYVTALRPLAIRLAERAAPMNPLWYPEYIQEATSLDSRVAALSAALHQVRSGQNVLGIDPSEVPLYFQGTAAGAGGEFSAISDYLLGGYPNDVTAWAPALVQQAAGALDAAKAAYAAQLNRQLEVAQFTQSEDSIRLKYGDEILNLCGSVNDGSGLQLSALDILDHAPSSLDGAKCFKVHSPSCQITTNQLLAAYTADDVCEQLCVVGQVKSAAGKSAAKMNDPNLDALAAAGGCDPKQPTNLKQGVAGESWDLVTNKADYKLSASGAGSIMGEADTKSVDDAARSICKVKFPKGVDPLPGPGSVNPGILDPSCFQGALGQEALTLTSIAKNVDIARSEYADQMDAYNIAMKSCLILKQGDSDIDAATKNFDDTMNGLRIAKTACDAVAAVADGVKDCADSAGNISDDITGASAVSCGASAVKAAATVASDVLQEQMDSAQANHDALVQTLQHSIDEQRCANDASQYIVAQHTQALRIAQAVIDFQVAQNQLQQDEASVQQLLSEGRKALASVSSGVTVNPAFDFWLSSDIQTFQKAFALAQRTTYLAVRAAEYEFQASLLDANATNPGTTYTSEVLAARLPQDLTNVINSLLEVTGTGGVNGNRPSPLTVIISLRDALFQLADESKLPPDKHVLTGADRFHELLASSKYAVHDSNGNYLGQQIPFSLAPLGAPSFGQKNTQSISIFAGTSCAERIWSVFAAIEGSNNLFVGSSSTPFAQINLLKSNTFYSQWCSTPSPDGTPFQKSTVNPSINLFEDPEQGAPGQTSGFGTGAGNTSYTPARLDAYFNVSATDLAQQAYANGQDNELATRGLYGDYALYLPAAELSQPGVAGPSTGLDLNGVDDILLRIDYVSVAKN